ncbi:MAG: lysylphosphatidylglycerol synthase domain-containing protein [Bacteroidota bacterium]
MANWRGVTARLAQPTVRRAAAGAFSIAVFLLALAVLHRAIGRIDIHQVAITAAGFPAQKLVAALLLALASYAALGGFDWLGLHHVRRPLPVASTLLVSFVSHAVSHNAGFAVLTGGSVRLRMYAAFGLGMAEVGGIVAFAGLSFALGIGTLASIAFIVEGARLAPLLHLPAPLVTGLGWGGAGLLAGYFAWTALAHRPLAIGRWWLATPSVPLALGQIAVAAADLALVAGALYLLLPMAGTGISYPAFIGIYVVATTAGTLSHVPGGLGVFEGALTLLLPAPAADILAAMLVFRVFYNLIPLVLAALVLAVFELVQRYRHAAPPGWIVDFGPPLAALLGIVCALALLLPAPDTAVGPRWLGETAWLLSGAAAGVLLALPWGLSRQARWAYRLALASLAGAAVLALLRGPDWIVASIPTFSAAALAAASPLFGQADDQRAIPWPWAGAGAAIMVGAAWLAWRAGGEPQSLRQAAMAAAAFTAAAWALRQDHAKPAPGVL